MPENNKGDQNDSKINKEIEESSDSALEGLPQEVTKVIEELPDEELRVKLKAAFALSIKSTHYQGPIPDPDMLRDYNNIVENGAERIVKQFEEQSRHRRNIEKEVVEGQVSESKRGQIFAFIIGMTGLGFAFASALMGYKGFAITLASTTIVGLVSAFIVGKRIQAKDLKEKE
jgi:uncharacterized membrane protein